MGSGLSGCFLQGECPDDFRGIHHHDEVQTTIVGPFTNPPARNFTPLVGPTCGDLGDVSPGTVIKSQASLTAPGDGCSDDVSLVPQAVSTGTLSQSKSGVVSIHLPNGCSGVFDVAFASANGSSSYLDNGSVSSGSPDWWVVRTFTVSGDRRLCFSGDNPPTSCADAFLATNVLVP